MENSMSRTYERPVTSPVAQRTPARVLTVRQFHAAIDGAIGLNSLYGFARSGRLKTVKVGRKHLILASELENFFQREAEVN